MVIGFEAAVREPVIADILLSFFPTVARDTERLRFTPGSMHDDRMIEELITALQHVWKTLDLPRKRH